MLSKILITFLLIFSFSIQAEDPRPLQIALANLKYKKINKLADMKNIHNIFSMALPYMGSEGEERVNIAVVKLYASSLKVHDYPEHLETIYPKIAKERAYFDKIIKEQLSYEQAKTFQRHLKEYADFLKGGNG